MTDPIDQTLAAASQPQAGGEDRAVIAELFQLIVGTDLRQAANDAALLVVQLTTLSFLIEKFGVDIDDIARRVEDVRASGAESPLFKSPEVGARCEAIMGVLRFAYRVVATPTTKWN